MKNEVQYKHYNVYCDGRKFGEMEVPSDENNCYWYKYKVWTLEEGFKCHIPHRDEEGQLWELIASNWAR
jgi:hypothetical protein